MIELDFERLATQRGLWHPIHLVKQFETQSQLLTQEIPNALADTVRDAHLSNPNREFLEAICDYVVFDSIFIDALAMESAGIDARALDETLGPLSDSLKAIRIPDEVYYSALDHIQNFKRTKHRKLRYLEDAYPEYARGHEFFYHPDKRTIDRFAKRPDTRSIPSAFVDSEGCVERVLLYAEVQRQSKHPVKLAEPHKRVFERFRGALPISIIEALSGENAQASIEGVVREHEPELFSIPVPPIFDIVFDQIRASKTPKSISQAIFEIRKDWDAVQYRNLMYDVSQSIINRDFVRLRNIQSELKSHLKALNRQGNAKSRFTSQLYGVLGFFGFGIEGNIPIPRHQKYDYVAFIGRWLGQ